MVNNDFLKALKEFMEDRADSIDFSAESPEYQQVDESLDKLYERIESLLDEQGQELLMKHDTAHNDKVSKVIEISYQKGFKEGLKLLTYCLIDGELTESDASAGI